MDKNIFYTAIQAAIEAGAKIMQVYTDPNANFEIERKADNSPLTVADRKSHQVIASKLAATPYPILSEEGKAIPTEERRQWKQLWVVDPLDGTKEFIKKNGEFTVNIAFVENGVPTAGVIYIPVKQELYFADQELGAYKLSDITSLENLSLEDLIRKAQRLPLTQESRRNYTIVASRSHLTPETEQFIQTKQEIYAPVDIVSKGSSLKLCLIAEGKADAYPRFAPTMEWDTAAGHAIILATGKNVRQVESCEPLEYNKENLLNPWFIAE